MKIQKTIFKNFYDFFYKIARRNKHLLLRIRAVLRVILKYDLQNDLSNEIAILKAQLEGESSKIDYLMGYKENLLAEKINFEAARKTLKFQSVYNSKQPLITICIATCNRRSLLIDRCISSLLKQSYKNIQIVVVGDHCTDDTEYFLSKLRDSRIIFQNLPERGPYPKFGINRWYVAGTNPMNHAMDLAEGDFIMHLDDDDESTADRVESLVEIALLNRLEFVWHKFLAEFPNGVWETLGITNLQIGQVTTGSIFYHRYFSRFKWDPLAYKLKEPGDWNRIRKIKSMAPKMTFLDKILTIHYREQTNIFVPQHNEQFMEV
jgi:hypothetical protein